jgi:hypothetical protein
MRISRDVLFATFDLRQATASFRPTRVIIRPLLTNLACNNYTVGASIANCRGLRRSDAMTEGVCSVWCGMGWGAPAARAGCMALCTAADHHCESVDAQPKPGPAWVTAAGRLHVMHVDAVRRRCSPESGM